MVAASMCAPRPPLSFGAAAPLCTWHGWRCPPNVLPGVSTSGVRLVVALRRCGRDWPRRSRTPGYSDGEEQSARATLIVPQQHSAHAAPIDSLTLPQHPIYTYRESSAPQPATSRWPTRRARAATARAPSPTLPSRESPSDAWRDGSMDACIGACRLSTRHPKHHTLLTVSTAATMPLT